jgi:hypothetical protein
MYKDRVVESGKLEFKAQLRKVTKLLLISIQLPPY